MLDRFSFATGTNVDYLEDLYKQYQADKNSVEESWRVFFEGYDFAVGSGLPVAQGASVSNQGVGDLKHAGQVESLINAYRRLGHLSAQINPMEKAELLKELSYEGPDLIGFDKSTQVHPAHFKGAENGLPLSDLVDKLQRTYCRDVGADFRELHVVEMVKWLQDEMESCENKPAVDQKLQLHLYKKLAQAELFEKFLHNRYLGQKRFSIEGLDTLIPLLDILVDESSKHSVEEMNLGMAHRGRLNVLANIMEKDYQRMLSEFEGAVYNPFDIDGDVKYHLGYASDVKTFSGNDVRLYLSPNPSHLEAVNPVIEGFARARQEQLDNKGKVLPVLLHGDAAFIGQGLVAETLNLSQLDGYTTGGTVHIITNNMIGFTTNPTDSKSCSYSSDIAKIVRAPVLHVNADNPEAVVWCAQLAARFRAKFGHDIVIDLIGYRRHGHNETDEPAFTQPVLYRKIKKHKTALTLYHESLMSSGTEESALKDIQKGIKDELEAAYNVVHGKKVKFPAPDLPTPYKAIFNYRKAGRKEVIASTATELTREELNKVGQHITQVPEGFDPHPKITKLLAGRRKMLSGEGSIDWGLAELLAFGSLAADGHSIRLSGQDCKRGTFSSRHGVVFDVNDQKPHSLLEGLGEGQVTILNSPLSEQSCLGFEFGYSVASINSLVLWEAQFGDFANGAQIIIDQFIVASEAKWQQTTGMVMLLPHGYEGMGPEHSSARPERFLQCCGNLNIQVANVTTPAQYFHLLRRQMKRKFKKPLVVMTPKSLLRHPRMVSKLTEFEDQKFQAVIDDATIKSKKSVEQVIMCTGKVYFDLIAKREGDSTLAQTPILRLEQLYPFPYENIEKILSTYPNMKQLIWVQEEPENMGAWTFALARLKKFLPIDNVKYVGRKNSGTTAEGSGKSHQLEQSRIVDEAFSLVCGWTPGAKKVK